MCLGGGVEGGFDFLEIAGSERAIRADWTFEGDGVLKVLSRKIREYNSSPTTIRVMGDPLAPHV